MARQNAFHHRTTILPTDADGMIQPVDVTHMIPTARQAKESRTRRRRDWEKKNPSNSYRVPSELHMRAKEISASLSSIAGEYLSTTSSVAAAFVTFSLSHLRSGKLTIEPHPNPERRTLTLHWTEVENGWPKEIKPLKRKKEGVLAKKDSIFLGYRWGADIDKQIEAIAKQTGVPGGEVVVFLLNHAIEAYRRGQLTLTPEAVVVTNKVTSSYGD